MQDFFVLLPTANGYWPNSALRLQHRRLHAMFSCLNEGRGRNGRALVRSLARFEESAMCKTNNSDLTPLPLAVNIKEGGTGLRG